MSPEAEARAFTIVGVAVALCVAVVGLLVVLEPFNRRPVDQVSMVIDTPYVGQGVSVGTAMMLHGVKVGQVSGISSRPSGGVRLGVDFQAGPTTGLTDAMGIDFRPANYFGVTAINVIPTAGGQVIKDGMTIDLVPRGNFTLETLLSDLKDLTGGVITTQLIEVVERTTRYTDALNPLFETMVIAADAITEVQTVSTAQLLTNATGVSVALPGFVEAASSAVDDFAHSGLTRFLASGPGGAVAGEPISEEFWQSRHVGTLEMVTTSFFAKVGTLVSKHVEDLLPAVQMVQTLSDTVPGVVTPPGVADSLVELRTRLEKLYGGTPEQRALQVHIVLDNIPGVAAPLAAMGVPQ
ncbi:Mammalian cell entry related domain protein [Mycolicibacterium moriokaense]|nr:Mammalian cell entry related domain protein [Mycolicibacterium moriokaense]MCV7039142.1 Mammalian cell entry related domain protein [Mycolicibacterium moriokaense]ORB18568.1 Mammalian cell entry related domain protein [Mycolicibacterium moriokaense]